jgi:hypothetical protein
MGFSVAGGSYRWVYVPTQGKPLISNLQVEVGEAGGKKKLYPALNMANATEVKRWGVKTAYSLVEVEVNDKLGSPADESFVATKMTPLDGTAKYPLQLSEVIADAKKRYQAHVKSRQKKIDAEFDAVKKKMLKGRKVTGPRTTSELMYVTWLPDSQRVKVAFRTQINDGAFTETTIRGNQPFGLPPPPKPKDKGAALAFRPPPPRDITVKFGLAFGVELGTAYEYDIKGKPVASQELTPQAFSKELPPPPGVKLPQK